MIILKINQKGHFIEIPGITPFRTPADVDITNVSIPLVASKLTAQGVEHYEIISDTIGKEKRYTQKDFMSKKKIVQDQGARIDKLEHMLEKVLTNLPGNTIKTEEQINKKLDLIEKLIQSQPKIKERIITTIESTTKGKKKKDPDINKELFIPTVDVGNMQISGDTKQLTKQKYSDLDSAADLLANIGK